METIDNIELLDCPICRGAGLLEEESGWCMYVSCMDCGCHTAAVSFRCDEERENAARQAASLWNIGKVISSSHSE